MLGWRESYQDTLGNIDYDTQKMSFEKFRRSSNFKIFLQLPLLLSVPGWPADCDQQWRHDLCTMGCWNRFSAFHASYQKHMRPWNLGKSPKNLKSFWEALLKSMIWNCSALKACNNSLFYLLIWKSVFKYILGILVFVWTRWRQWCQMCRM